MDDRQAVAWLHRRAGFGLHPSPLDAAAERDLLDGDLRPQIDPRTMFTSCLDWLDVDVERILGRRYDDIPLLA